MALMIDSADYYRAVAERMAPFLVGRNLAVEQRFRDGERLVYRRHEGSGAERRWITIRNAADVVRWARQKAVAFHANVKPEGPGAWFFLDLRRWNGRSSVTVWQPTFIGPTRIGVWRRSTTQSRGVPADPEVWSMVGFRGFGRTAPAVRLV